MKLFEPSDYQIKPNGPLSSEAIRRLVEIRERRGLSYAALGTEVGLSGTFVYNLLNKGMNVGTQHVRRIAEAIIRLEDPAQPQIEAAPAAKAGSLNHTYHLRPDFKVAIDLPADITEKEAERLSLFIRSLPAA